MILDLAGACATTVFSVISEIHGTYATTVVSCVSHISGRYATDVFFLPWYFLCHSG